MRITSHAHPIQNSGSNAFIDRILSMLRIPNAVSVARAASPCATFLPPSSRAIRAVRTTSNAPASAGSKRIAASESPIVDRTTQAINAISGGWST
jgi:hypothetical protein